MPEKVKILVIDDNTDFVAGIRILLARENCIVYEAFNGKQGLEVLEKSNPDIVLLDMIMPVMDGQETLKQIRQNPTHDGVLVVLLSGIKTSTDDQASGLESGADGYITRPISNRELLARIRTFIRLKLTEKSLSISEEKYRMLFNTMIIGYAHHQIILDDKGMPIDYQFLEVNPEFEKQTGAKAQDVVGKRVMEVFPETEEKWIERYGQVALTGKAMRFVDYSSRIDKFFEVYAFSPNKGEFSTLFYDVTKRELNEARNHKYREELQRINQAKDKLFSIIAHDLRSPLNAIMGLLEILDEQYQTLTTAEIQKIIKSSRQTSLNLYSLIDNLLQWARLQKDHLVFKPIGVNLADAVRECVSLYHPLATRKQVNMLFDIPDRMMAYADPQMLNVIIRNLISNAIKYTKSGGEIHIHAQLDPSGFLTLRFKDNGIGMNPELLKTIFDKETESSRPGTEGETSTGLGLMLVREFVSMHGGKIQAESEEEKGSTFTVRLPAMEA